MDRENKDGEWWSKGDVQRRGSERHKRIQEKWRGSRGRHVRLHQPSIR